MYKASELDVLEALFIEQHQPCIYFYLTLDAPIDIRQLTIAINRIHHIVPELACRYDPIRNAWYPLEHTDIIQEVIAFDNSLWDLTKDAQWKLQILHHKAYDELAIGVSHIVCDGAGAKQLLQLLCKAYRNEQLNGIHNVRSLSILPYKTSSQGVGKRKKGQSHRIQTSSGSKREGNITRFNELEKLRNIAKSYEATINDVALMMIMKAFAQEFDCASLTISCPVNLRSFLLYVPDLTITNFTGGYEVTIEDVKHSRKNLLYEIHRQMKEERYRNQDLSLIKPLHYAYRFMPKRLFHVLSHVCYHIPSLSFTNLGILEHLDFKDCEVVSAYVMTTMHEFPTLQISLMTYDQMVAFSIHTYATEDELQRLHQLMNDLTIS